eukprot:gene17285-18907_t
MARKRAAAEGGPAVAGVGAAPDESAGSWKAYVNTVCMMMGVGLLGYPATVAKGGWIMMGIIPVLVVMACYTSRLLTEQLYVDVPNGGKKITSYPELGWRVGGWWGVAASHASMKVVLFTVSGVMAYLGSSMATSAFLAGKYGHDWPNDLPADVNQDDLTKTIVTYFCIVSLLPILSLPSLRELSWLASVGTVAT